MINRYIYIYIDMCKSKSKYGLIYRYIYIYLFIYLFIYIYIYIYIYVNIRAIYAHLETESMITEEVFLKCIFMQIECIHDSSSCSSEIFPAQGIACLQLQQQQRPNQGCLVWISAMLRGHHQTGSSYVGVGFVIVALDCTLL